MGGKPHDATKEGATREILPKFPTSNNLKQAKPVLPSEVLTVIISLQHC